MKLTKKLILPIIIVVAIAVVALIGYNYLDAQNRITGDTLASGIRNIGNLETAEYYYSHVEAYDSGKRKLLGLPVPFTNSKFVYTCSGTITAGINFEEIQIDKTEDTITIYLPQAAILSSEIDEESFKVYDEKNNIFNPIEVENVTSSFADVKQSEENKAINDGLLTRANDNAKVLIENFLKGAYDLDNYKIEFKEKQ